MSQFMNGSALGIISIIVFIVLSMAAFMAFYASKNGLNGKKWFLQGLFLPLISIVNLNNALKKEKKKKKQPKKAKPSITVTKEVVSNSQEATSSTQEAKEEVEVVDAVVRERGFDEQEYKERAQKKKAILEDIRKKHQVSLTGVIVNSNEDLLQFLAGYWIFENDKNSSIFQVYVFDENSLRVDASFPRFAMAPKEVAYTVTLMGSYIKLQGNPQKVHFLSKDEVIIGARKIMRISRKEYKQLSDALHSLSTDADMLFGE